MKRPNILSVVVGMTLTGGVLGRDMTEISRDGVGNTAQISRWNRSGDSIVVVSPSGSFSPPLVTGDLTSAEGDVAQGRDDTPTSSVPQTLGDLSIIRIDQSGSILDARIVQTYTLDNQAYATQSGTHNLATSRVTVQPPPWILPWKVRWIADKAKLMCEDSLPSDWLCTRGELCGGYVS